MSTSVRDAWTLLGMHTRAAWAIAVLFLFSLTLLAVTSWGTIQNRWPVVVALLITAGAVAGLLAVRPDPLPTGATIAMTAAGPVSCALVLAVLPVPRTSAAQTWPFAAGVAVATYMCVRGRTLAAWIDVLGMIAVALTWSLSTGQGVGPGITISIFNLGPLAMGTVFAYTLRPAARTIVELREQATERIAEQAATAASLEERDSQLRQLDRLVRPTLDKIARGDPVDASTRLECALLEAELRDSLRAPHSSTSRCRPRPVAREPGASRWCWWTTAVPTTSRRQSAGVCCDTSVANWMAPRPVRSRSASCRPTVPCWPRSCVAIRCADHDGWSSTTTRNPLASLTMTPVLGSRNSDLPRTCVPD